MSEFYFDDASSHEYDEELERRQGSNGSGVSPGKVSLTSRIARAAPSQGDHQQPEAVVGQSGRAAQSEVAEQERPPHRFRTGASPACGTNEWFLYRLLRDRWTGTRLMNMLQAGVRNPRLWRARLRNLDLPIEPGIERRFHEQLATPEGQSVAAQVDETLQRFRRYPKSGEWPIEARRVRDRTIGALRQLLAQVCVDALEPDLVILDEFQRFKQLLEEPEDGRKDSESNARELAQKLFNATTPEGNPVRTLLLSATPYKLYTADAESQDEDHYSDFIATVQFLMGGRKGAARIERLETDLSIYRKALYQAAAGQPDHVEDARDQLQRDLSRFMARTERVEATKDRQAMVSERKSQARLVVDDVKRYVATDRLFRAVGAADPMPLWKSAPYLLHFMRNYRFNDHLDRAIETRSDALSAVLRENKEVFLDRAELDRYEVLDPSSARLRALADRVLGNGQWQLLWLPPTVPYWPLGGPFAACRDLTKTLVFSAWNVVPDVISAVLSYEAERRMMGKSERAYTQSSHTRLLELGREMKGLRALVLRYPCQWLADNCHPLAELAAGADLDDVKHRVRNTIVDALDKLQSSTDEPSEQPMPGEPPGIEAAGGADTRWYWAAPVLLDCPVAEAFLTTWKLHDSLDDADSAQGVVGSADEDDKDRADEHKYFPAYVEALQNVRADELGRQPDDLADVLTDVALGSPAVLAMRALAFVGVAASTRARLAAAVADAFWSLFNQPAVTAMVRRIRGSADNTPYWRAVLRYAIDGKLAGCARRTSASDPRAIHLGSERDGGKAGHRNRPDFDRRCPASGLESTGDVLSRN